MSTSANDSAGLYRRFEAIDIDALNDKAAMLQRTDNKYIMDAAVLEQALPALAPDFHILESGGLRAFRYENCYFDGPEWQSYFDHHQGRRKRAKIRMRKYVDAGLCFVEVKLKDKRGMTVKRRLPCDPAAFGSLDAAAIDHIQTAYREMYLGELPYSLSRTLDTRYSRVTLVAKRGGERMTIDGRLRFLANGKSKQIEDRCFLVETKSANRNGLADRILHGFHQHALKRCSKYCAGMVFLQPGLKHNNFRSIVRKLDQHAAETPAGAEAAIA